MIAFIRILVFASALAARAAGQGIAIEVDLAAQTASLLHDGSVVYVSPISSGRAGYRTPRGNFQVLEKDADHLSSLYGSIVDASGRTIVESARSGMAVPAGGRFIPAPMPHFVRFDGGNGLHGGYLPGYPASHGCIRLPPAKAALFFNIAEIGTPVRIFGTPPGFHPAPKPKTTPAPVATPAPKKSWFPFSFQKRAPAPAASPKTNAARN